MKILGIIAEYNPFHNGHMYHLQRSKELTGADFVVSVMSGDFVQRGEPALLDKWKRAEIAVNCGIDLILELPFAFACNNSEYFAKGAVNILNGLGCVDYLSFGSESGHISDISGLATYLSKEDEHFKVNLKQWMDSGLSYAASRQRAATYGLGDVAGNLLKSPNNILGVEYLKQLILTNSVIKPITVKRTGPGDNDTVLGDGIASATAIRHKIEETFKPQDISPFVPLESLTGLIGFDSRVNVKINNFYELVISGILRSTPLYLSELLAAGEGLENRMKTSVRNAGDMEELISLIVSKRYARTRISRLLMQLLVGLTKKSFFSIAEKNLCYGRVLALNQRGGELLRHIKQTECASIPIITNINKELVADDGLWELLQYDILASDLYNLAGKRSLYHNSDYVMKPFVKKTKAELP